MRHTKLMIAFLAILVLLSTSCAKLQARDNLNKGVRAFKNAQYEEAISFFNEAVRLDPELVNAQLYLATAYSQMFIPGATSPDNQKHAEMAIQTFEQVLQRDTSNVSAIAGLASIYQNNGDPRKARDMYKKNADLDPTNPVPLYAVGSVNWIIAYDKATPALPEEKTQLVDEGLQYLDKALQLNPDYEDAMSYKNLLLRIKAEMAENEEQKAQLIAQADEWFNKALETRKRLAEKRAAGGLVLDK